MVLVGAGRRCFDTVIARSPSSGRHGNLAFYSQKQVECPAFKNGAIKELTPLKGRTRIFLFTYIPGIVILAVLTLTRVNPFVFPMPGVRLTHILPMTGYTVLFVGTVLGGLILHMMGEKNLVRPFIGGGLILTLAVSILVSNVFRAHIVRKVGTRSGVRHARAVARKQKAYKVAQYDAREHGGYLRYFLHRKRYRQILEDAFYAGYKQTFQTEFSHLVDPSLIEEKGYRHGLEAGRARARNARIQGRSGVEPLDETILARLRTKFLPHYVEGYLEGYKAGQQEVE